MPAVSPEQQRLFGQAYAIKTGKLKPSDLNPEYRDQIVKLSDSMTVKKLKDFAETTHDEMEEEEESEINEMKNIPMYEDFVSVTSVNGMGTPSFPSDPGDSSNFVDQKTGSGDIPHTIAKGKPKKKKKSSFTSYKDFVKGSNELRSTF